MEVEEVIWVFFQGLSIGSRIASTKPPLSKAPYYSIPNLVSSHVSDTNLCTTFNSIIERLAVTNGIQDGILDKIPNQEMGFHYPIARLFSASLKGPSVSLLPT